MSATSPSPVHVNDARHLVRWGLMVVAPVVAVMMLAAALVRPLWAMAVVLAAAGMVLVAVMVIGLLRGPPSDVG